MNEFEKWYKEKYPQALKQNTTDSDKYALEIWQAATAESDKRIAGLKAHINDLREALKENDFPNSANLDIYNSVHFSNGSRGTMIMESKIVKWLCRNRAKDYFDEMVESK